MHVIESMRSLSPCTRVTVAAALWAAYTLTISHSVVDLDVGRNAAGALGFVCAVLLLWR